MFLSASWRKNEVLQHNSLFEGTNAGTVRPVHQGSSVHTPVKQDALISLVSSLFSNMPASCMLRHQGIRPVMLGYHGLPAAEAAGSVQPAKAADKCLKRAHHGCTLTDAEHAERANRKRAPTRAGHRRLGQKSVPTGRRGSKLGGIAISGAAASELCAVCRRLLPRGREGTENRI